MELLVGIDFGTTNTVITYFNNNKVSVINDGIFKNIPSKIGKYNNKLYCGNYIPVDCNNIIHSFKLTIGNSDNFYLDNEKYTQFDLLIVFFNHLYEIINKYINNISSIEAIITVPSNFNDKQREIIKSAFESVNINVIRIINEPSAAALAYGLNHSTNENEKILIIDIGGGTTDMTVLEKTDLFFEVCDSRGLNDLGGNDFTKLIYDDIIRNSINNDRLWNISQTIKEKLSYLDSYETTINNKNYLLTRAKFENLSSKLINRIEDTIKDIIENYTINYVILVGCSSKIPILQKTIKNITKKNIWIHPSLDSVVAEGAGLYAGIIKNKYKSSDDVVLIDILPLSLGVELADGSYSVIIPKGTPLPFKKTQKYTTDTPYENSVKVKIYQGERKIANKNMLIGEFIFDKVSVNCNPIIDITFKIDVNSIINVSIVDKKSGVEKNIIIKNIDKIENVSKIIEQANSLNDNDEKELVRNHNIYAIKTFIENSLNNLSVNELISQDDKNKMLDDFKRIENELETMNNLQLIENLKYIQDTYSLLGNAVVDNSFTETNEIDNMFIIDRKNELKNKINILLNKNPDWKEYLQPVLDELSYNSVSIEYINEKLNDINELEKDDSPNYKQQFNNLCLFIKNELENGRINIKDIDNLNKLINDSLDLLNKDNINWEDELNNLNKKCLDLYNK